MGSKEAVPPGRGRRMCESAASPGAAQAALPSQAVWGDAPVSAEHAQRLPRPKAESRWPSRASSAEARALFPPMGRGAAARGRISHKLFYFTERPHGGAAKRAAQAPRQGRGPPPSRLPARRTGSAWRRRRAPQAGSTSAQYSPHVNHTKMCRRGKETRPHSIVRHMPGRAPYSREIRMCGTRRPPG